MVVFVIANLLQIVDATSGGPHICITCLHTVEKAAILKDRVQNHEYFSKLTPEKIQTSANSCSGCSTTTPKSVSNDKGCLISGKIDDGNSMTNLTEVMIELISEGLADKFIVGVVVSATPNQAEPCEEDVVKVVNEGATSSVPADLETFTETSDIEMLLPSMVPINDFELGRITAMYDLMKINVAEDSKGGGPSQVTC